MTIPFVLCASTPMPEVPPQLAYILIVIIFSLGALIYKVLHLQKREEEFRDWAKKKGFRFRWEDRQSIKEHYPGFRCLWKGNSQSVDMYANGVLNGHTMSAFDYRSTVHVGTKTAHHSFSAAIVDLDISLKPLAIAPETMKTRLTDWMSNNDIDFESLDFNRRFFVRSPDRQWAYDVLHQGMMDYLMSAPEFTVELAGKSLIAYRDELIPIPDFEKAVQLLEGITSRLPAYAIEERKGTT